MNSFSNGNLYTIIIQIQKSAFKFVWVNYTLTFWHLNPSKLKII